MARRSGARRNLLVAAILSPQLFTQLGCRPPEEPAEPAPEPVEIDTTTVEQPEPPPSPIPEQPEPEPELRFVRWGGAGVDLRLSHVEIARRHAAIASCLISETTAGQPVLLRVAATDKAPAITIEVGETCIEQVLAGVELLDAAGQPVQTADAWLELTMVINPADAGLSAASQIDDVRVDSDGKCIERHESPCAPHKSCMADLLVQVACPTDAGLATPTHDPASTLMLVWNDTPTPDRPRRLVVERWNELCSLEVREPSPTDPDADYQVTRAGPIPCALLDGLVADAKRVDRALQKHKPQISNLDLNLVNVHVNRLEPHWNAIRMVTDWAARSDVLPEPSAQMLTTLEAAIERWTLAVTSAT